MWRNLVREADQKNTWGCKKETKEAIGLKKQGDRGK